MFAAFHNVKDLLNLKEEVFELELKLFILIIAQFEQQRSTVPTLASRSFANWISKKTMHIIAFSGLIFPCPKTPELKKQINDIIMENDGYNFPILWSLYHRNFRVFYLHGKGIDDIADNKSMEKMNAAIEFLQVQLDQFQESTQHRFEKLEKELEQLKGDEGMEHV